MTNRLSWRSGWVTIMATMMLMAVVLLAGCVAQQDTRLDEIRKAYAAQEYDKAYRMGVAVSQIGGDSGQRAAYLAGVSAYKLGHHNQALPQLAYAARSPDTLLAGDSLAVMGLIYALQNNHLRAAESFLGAASRMQGQGRANAYFYAAISEQKLGRWADARTHLSLARAGSSDPKFRQQVDDQFSVTGYSLQLGAFAQPENARRALSQWASRVQGLRIGQPRLVPQRLADGSTITVVQVGQFSSYATALMARQDLGSHEVIIVPLR